MLSVSTGCFTSRTAVSLSIKPLCHLCGSFTSTNTYFINLWTLQLENLLVKEISMDLRYAILGLFCLLTCKVYKLIQ